MGHWPTNALLCGLLLLGGCTRAPLVAEAPVGAGPVGAGQLGSGPVGSGTDWSRARPIEVVLDEYAFQPDRITLRVAEPVLLRLINRGARPHDFTAPGFFARVATRPGDAMAARLRAAGGTVDVPAGGAREVLLVPLAAGTWPLDCDKPLHGMFGMTGEIVVSP